MCSHPRMRLSVYRVNLTNTTMHKSLMFKKGRVRGNLRSREDILELDDDDNHDVVKRRRTVRKKGLKVTPQGHVLPKEMSKDDTPVDDHEYGLDATFTVETRVSELDKRREEYVSVGLAKADGEGNDDKEKESVGEQSLYKIPEHLRVESTITDTARAHAEPTGLVEVDLPVKYKLQNIAKTKEQVAFLSAAVASDDAEYSKFVRRHGRPKRKK